MSNPQSFNRYSYVNNDPVNLIDPNGLMPNLCLDIWTGDGASRQCFGPYLPWGGFTPKENPVPNSAPTNPEVDEVPLETCAEDSNGALASLRRDITFSLQPGAQQRPGSPPIRPVFSPDFARRLGNAIFEMNQVGIAPQINDGFRTATDQNWYQTHGAGGGRPVNMHVSDHQTGNAVDINAVTPTMRGILQKHGLSPLPGDPPHFYIGVNNVSAAAARAEEYYWKHCASLTGDPLPSIKD